MSTDREPGEFDLSSELAALGLGPEYIEQTLGHLGAADPDEDCWEPEPGYLDRITRGTQRRVSDRDALLAVVDLFGLAFHTSKELMAKDGKQ